MPLRCTKLKRPVWLVLAALVVLSVVVAWICRDMDLLSHDPEPGVDNGTRSEKEPAKAHAHVVLDDTVYMECFSKEVPVVEEKKHVLASLYRFLQEKSKTCKPDAELETLPCAPEVIVFGRIDGQEVDFALYLLRGAFRISNGMFCVDREIVQRAREALSEATQGQWVTPLSR